jgi:transposase, IS5 family
MQITLFDPNSTYSSKWYIFKRTTELGAIYDTIVWKRLAELLPQKKTLKGAPAWLPPQGLFGLMFLKHYTSLSDEKLMERFHTDWAMQLFCGVLLQENERIRDNAFVSKVRSYLSNHLDLNQLQQKLIENWKKQGLVDTHILMMDATCYESYIRYPTDVKLLWECCEHLWTQMISQVCKTFKLRQPRSKYKEQRKKYLHYSKLKRKTYRKTKARKKPCCIYYSKG